jgi:hypothetical protein
MPKIRLATPLESLSGTLDGLVFKHYRKDKRGLVVSRKPDMSKVRPSPAQLAQRKRMRQATCAEDDMGWASGAQSARLPAL